MKARVSINDGLFVVGLVGLVAGLASGSTALTLAGIALAVAVFTLTATQMLRRQRRAKKKAEERRSRLSDATTD